MILGWLVAIALAAPLTADEVVAAALARDPSIVASEAAVLAAEGEWKAARGLRHDPTLEARLGFGVVQHEASLTQPLSLSGEGIAAARSARASLAAAEALRERRRLEVAADARRLLIRVVRAEAELGRAEEVAALAVDLRTAAERRFATGDAAELEVHLARLEESAAAAVRLVAVRDALAAREDFAARTGLPPDADLPSDPLAGAPAEAAPAERSDRVAADARVEAADTAVRRERSATLAPVDLGVWAQLQGDAAWTVGPTIGVTLPLWAGNRAGIARAVGDQEVARADRAALLGRLDAEGAGSVERRSAIAGVSGTADPTTEARAALVGVDAAVAAGEMGGAEAAILRGRILDAWGRGASARAEAALVVVDLALAESWPTLAPATP